MSLTYGFYNSLNHVSGKAGVKSMVIVSAYFVFHHSQYLVYNFMKKFYSLFDHVSRKAERLIKFS